MDQFSSETPKVSSKLPRYLQLLLVVVAIAGCLLGIRSAATYGLSHVLVMYSLTTGNIAGARKATELAPKDAETHFAHAAVLSLTGANKESIAELEHAVALRPADYGLWLELGLMRDQLGDTQGSLQAFEATVARAPHYSKPHWLRGNVLLRSGQIDAAFKDLNTAAQSDVDLIPALVDLAWGMSGGDVGLTEQLAEINNDQKRLAFAKVLVRTGKYGLAVEQLKLITDFRESSRREFVDQLLAKHAFKEAFAVWSVARSEAPAGVFDGGFEGVLSSGTTGFGWRVPHDLQATSIYLSTTTPHTGAKSLTVEYNGNSGPGVFFSQLILVEPSSHYQLNFASRSEKIITGGLPILAVDKAGDQQRLAHSAALPSGTTDWMTFSFDFTTTPDTTAIIVSLQRENCPSGPCPIFGSVSFDSFSLAKLK